jgi:hypothetical protein
MGSVIGNIKVSKVDPSSEFKSQRKFHLSIEVNLDLTSNHCEPHWIRKRYIIRNLCLI